MKRIGILVVLNFTVFLFSVAVAAQTPPANPVTYDQVRTALRAGVSAASIADGIARRSVNYALTEAQVAELKALKAPDGALLDPRTIDTVLVAIKNNLRVRIRVECRPSCDFTVGGKTERGKNIYEFDGTAPKTTITASKGSWSSTAEIDWQTPYKLWDLVTYKIACNTPECEIHVDDEGEKPTARGGSYEYLSSSDHVGVWATAPGYIPSNRVLLTRYQTWVDLGFLSYQIVLGCKPRDCHFVISDGGERRMDPGDGRATYVTKADAVTVSATNDHGGKPESIRLTAKQREHVFDFGPVSYSLACVPVNGVPVACEIRVTEDGKSFVLGTEASGRAKYETYALALSAEPLANAVGAVPVRVDAAKPRADLPVWLPFAYSLACVEASSNLRTECAIRIVDAGKTVTLTAGARERLEYRTTSKTITAEAVPDPNRYAVASPGPVRLTDVSARVDIRVQPIITYSLACVDGDGALVPCTVRVTDAGKPRELTTRADERLSLTTASNSITVEVVANPEKYVAGRSTAVRVDSVNPRADLPVRLKIAYSFVCVDAATKDPVSCGVRVVDGANTITLEKKSGEKKYATTSTSITAGPFSERHVAAGPIAITMDANSPNQTFIMRYMKDGPETVLGKIRSAVGFIEEGERIQAQGRTALRKFGASTVWTFVDSLLGTSHIRWDFVDRNNGEYFVLGRGAKPQVQFYQSVSPEKGGVETGAGEKPKQSWVRTLSPEGTSERMTAYAMARPGILIPSLFLTNPAQKVEFTKDDLGQLALRVVTATDVYTISYTEAEYLPTRIQHQKNETSAPEADIRFENYLRVAAYEHTPSRATTPAIALPYRIEVRLGKGGFSQTLCVDTYFVTPKGANSIYNERMFDPGDKALIDAGYVLYKTRTLQSPMVFTCDLRPKSN